MACAQTGLTTEERLVLYQDYVTQNKLEPLKKITSFKFHSWRDLDNRHLIISTHISRPYFVTLKSTCVDLKWSHGIVIHNANSNTLQSKFDAISPVKFPHQKCFIDKIYKITKAQAKEIANLAKES